MFSWTVVLGKLPTCKMMQKRYHTCSICLSWCMSCRQKVETKNHLLTQCHFTSFLWFKALTKLGLVWVSLRSIRDFFAADLGRDLGRRGIIFYVVIVHCIYWLVGGEK